MEPTTKGYSPQVKTEAQGFISREREKLKGILGEPGERKLGLTEARSELVSTFAVQGTVAEAIYDLWHGPDEAEDG